MHLEYKAALLQRRCAVDHVCAAQILYLPSEFAPAALLDGLLAAAGAPVRTESAPLAVRAASSASAVPWSGIMGRVSFAKGSGSVTVTVAGSAVTEATSDISAATACSCA